MKRLLVLGCSGAGKSTLARELGEVLNLPVTHLDKLFWKPGWVESDEGEFRQKVANAVEGDAWIVLGLVDAEDKPLLYRSVDIFALPSHVENMPNSLIEAMAAGLPVVASRVGAIPEMVDGGATGLLIEPRDTKALTRKLVQLLESQGLRSLLGTRAADHASAAYDMVTLERELERVYSECTGAGRCRSR